MKSTRTRIATAALLIAGFALTSTTGSFAADATTKADRVAARTAYQAQVTAYKAAVAAHHKAVDAAHATIEAARATLKVALAAATTPAQKAAAKATFEAARTAAKATIPAQPTKPVKPAILVKATPAPKPAA